MSEDIQQEILNLKTWIVSLFETNAKQREEVDGRVDELFAQFEKQLAMLTSAYVEVAAMLEALVSAIINKDEQMRDDFFNNLSKSRKTMIDVLKHATNDAERNTESFVAYNPPSTSESDGATVPDEQ